MTFLRAVLAVLLATVLAGVLYVLWIVDPLSSYGFGAVIALALSGYVVAGD